MKTQLPGVAPGRASDGRGVGADDPPEDRRAHDRYPVRGVFVYAEGAVRGRVLDLSDGGLSLLTPRRVRPGDDISFRLTSEYGSKLSARVRWSRLERMRAHEDGSFESLYAAGVALLPDPSKSPSG